MSLEVFVLGTGGMMPLPNRFLTSVLVRREGDLMLFDCGEGTQVALRSLNLRWKKISTIFISHTHADHVTGLPGILMLSSQVDRNEPLYIFGPPKIKDYVETSRRVLDMYINYEIIVCEISDFKKPQVILENKDYKVKCFPLDHTKPCIGYSLEEKSRPGEFFPEKAKELNVPVGPLWAQLQSGKSVTSTKGDIVEPSQVMGKLRSGRKFSFVTDTKYKASIAPEVAGSDLLICEGMFTHDLLESATEKKHLTSTQSAKIACDAGGIGSMGLIHYSPRYSFRELKQLGKEAKAIFPDTFLCKDGMTIDIPNKE